MIAALRSVVDDDPRWFALIHEFYQHFKYQTTTTNAVVQWWNTALKQAMTPFFNQYLRRTAVPTLELNFDETHGIVMYKWQAEEPGFAMPVKVGSEGHWQMIHPTREWQWMKRGLSKEQFSVATELFFVNVSKT